MEWLLQLRHFVQHHLDPGRLLHHLRAGLEQRRPDRDQLGLAADLGVHPHHRVLYGGTRVGLPDRGRHLLVGPHPGQAGGWLNLIGLIAVTASVDYGCATFLNLTMASMVPGWDGTLTQAFYLFLAIL